MTSLGWRRTPALYQQAVAGNKGLGGLWAELNDPVGSREWRALALRLGRAIVGSFTAAGPGKCRDGAGRARDLRLEGCQGIGLGCGPGFHTPGVR